MGIVVVMWEKKGWISYSIMNTSRDVGAWTRIGREESTLNL